MTKQLKRKLLYFYPRPPRGGRPDYPAPYNAPGSISTHALREEGDAISPAIAF